MNWLIKLATEVEKDVVALATGGPPQQAVIDSIGKIKDGVQVKGGAGGKVAVPAGAGVSGKAQDAPAAPATPAIPADTPRPAPSAAAVTERLSTMRSLIS